MLSEAETIASSFCPPSITLLHTCAPLVFLAARVISSVLEVVDKKVTEFAPLFVIPSA